MSMSSRRTVLAAACGTCVAALTGCATYGPGGVVASAPTSTTPATTVPPTTTGSAPSAEAPPGEEPPAEPAAPERSIPVADALAAAAAIPVGGGMIFADLDLVVTQPSAGEFKAFSATCTHQGCTVTSVADGQIVCACHNSYFAVADGAVTGGPAGAPLPERTVSVQDGSIVLA